MFRPPLYEALQAWAETSFLNERARAPTPDLAYNESGCDRTYRTILSRISRSLLTTARGRVCARNHRGRVPLRKRHARPRHVLCCNLLGGSTSTPPMARFRTRIAFGSSFPFRAMAQSINDYKKLDFRDGVRDKLFFFSPLGSRGWTRLGSDWGLMRRRRSSLTSARPLIISVPAAGALSPPRSARLVLPPSAALALRRDRDAGDRRHLGPGGGFSAFGPCGRDVVSNRATPGPASWR